MRWRLGSAATNWGSVPTREEYGHAVLGLSLGSGSADRTGGERTDTARRDVFRAPAAFAVLGGPIRDFRSPRSPLYPCPRRGLRGRLGSPAPPLPGISNGSTYR